MHCPFNIRQVPIASRGNLPARRGVTLLELLIAMAIIVLVTVTIIPMWNQAADSRIIREGVREVASLLNGARSKAIATGRPVGVWFEPLLDETGKTYGASVTLYYCEIPTPYAGEYPYSNFRVVWTGVDPDIDPNRPVVKGTFEPALNLTTINNLNIFAGEPNKTGDLMRLNNQSTTYEIKKQKVGTNWVMFKAMTDPATGGTSQTMALLCTDYSNTYVAPKTPTEKIMNSFYMGSPYQILRQPMKQTESMLQLPGSVCVDMTLSGIGSSTFTQPMIVTTPAFPLKVPDAPVVLVFGPNGSVQALYNPIPGNPNPIRPSETIYFHVGLRERRLLATVPYVKDPADANLLDTANMWIAVDHRTGAVTVVENKDATHDNNGNFIDATVAKYNDRINQSRSFARTRQSTGG